MFSNSPLKKNNFFQNDEFNTIISFISPNDKKIFLDSGDSAGIMNNYPYFRKDNDDIEKFAEKEIFPGFQKRFSVFGLFDLDSDEEDDFKRYGLENFNKYLNQIVLRKENDRDIFEINNKEKENITSSRHSSHDDNSKSTEKDSADGSLLIKDKDEKKEDKFFEIKKVIRRNLANNKNNNSSLTSLLQKKKKVLSKKRGRMTPEEWDAIKVPKAKHFMLDRKKHRIVFQRKHLKVIYSVVGLELPINFEKCFEKIKEHVGNKTKQNFGQRKSFHFVKNNGEEEIMILEDKKRILKTIKNEKDKRGNIKQIS